MLDCGGAGEFLAMDKLGKSRRIENRSLNDPLTCLVRRLKIATSPADVPTYTSSPSGENLATVIRILSFCLHDLLRSQTM